MCNTGFGGASFASNEKREGTHVAALWRMWVFFFLLLPHHFRSRFLRPRPEFPAVIFVRPPRGCFGTRASRGASDFFFVREAGYDWWGHRHTDLAKTGGFLGDLPEVCGSPRF